MPVTLVPAYNRASLHAAELTAQQPATAGTSERRLVMLRAIRQPSIGPRRRAADASQHPRATFRRRFDSFELLRS
jgi:hypothetical protein